MRVAVAQNFLPKIERIAILKAREILEHAAHGNVARANHTESPREIRDGATGGKLFSQNVDGNREPASLTVFVRIPNQLDKAEREKQACQKIKGTVLVAGNKEVGAPLLAGKLQIDFVPGGNFLDQF